MPKWAGGLGIPNLQWLNIALQARWPWLQQFDKDRPWAEFQIQVPNVARQIALSAMRPTVGSGQSIRFWEDRWIDGLCVADIAPNIYARVRPRTRKTCSVATALHDNAWTRDVNPELSPEALQEYFALWNRVAGITLDETRQDGVVWCWETNGIYSTRSAYAAKFWGREVDQTADFTWKARAPLRCRFFVWLATQNRCWTSDRLARRGLDHQDSCPLCGQEEESIDHLFIPCGFARQVWAAIFQAMDKPGWIPTMTDTLTGWCAAQNSNETRKRMLNAFRVLAMWEIWKHRNTIVFEGTSPSIPHVLRQFVEEGRPNHFLEPGGKAGRRDKLVNYGINKVEVECVCACN